MKFGISLVSYKAYRFSNLPHINHIKLTSLAFDTNAYQ